MLAALLASFLIAGVGSISYLAGRASRQEPSRFGLNTPSEARRAPDTLPVTMPQPAYQPRLKAEPSSPVARNPEEQSGGTVFVPEQRVEKRPVTLKTKERQSPRIPEFRPPRRVRVARRGLAQSQRVLYASQVIQLGVYPNRRQAKAAHARLVRVYPYLKTLPKTVEVFRPPSGGALAYQLRLKAYSPDYARAICQNLRAIGRGCAVLPVPA